MRNTANETVMQTVAEPSELEQSMSRLRRLRKGCKLLSEHQPCDRGSAVDIHDLITDEIIRVSDVLLTRPPTDLASMKAVAELLLWLADEEGQYTITR